MDISPILACGPNEGMMILVYTAYGGLGASAVSLATGVAGAVYMRKGKKTVGKWLVSFAILLAVVAAGVFFWLKSL